MMMEQHTDTIFVIEFIKFNFFATTKSWHTHTISVKDSLRKAAEVCRKPLKVCGKPLKVCGKPLKDAESR